MSIDTLPPKGFQRNEELLKRMDRLEQKAEQLTEQLQIGSVDPNAFSPSRLENEIVQHLNPQSLAYEVPGALPDKCYLWCPRRREHIDEAKQRAHRWSSKIAKERGVRGYEFVQKGMPEWEANDSTKAGLEHADGGLVIGDTVLMRIDRDIADEIRKNQEFFWQTRSGALMGDGTLQAMADQVRGKIKVKSFRSTPQEAYGGRLRSSGVPFKG